MAKKIRNLLKITNKQITILMLHYKPSFVAIGKDYFLFSLRK